MKAKLQEEINKLLLIQKAHIYEPKIEDVAEISFKAGEQESDKKWRQILKDSVVMAELTGVNKVVGWMNTHASLTGMTIYSDQWQAKVKEWLGEQNKGMEQAY